VKLETSSLIKVLVPLDAASAGTMAASPSERRDKTGAKLRVGTGGCSVSTSGIRMRSVSSYRFIAESYSQATDRDCRAKVKARTDIQDNDISHLRSTTRPDHRTTRQMRDETRVGRAAQAEALSKG
jgi:hypothetical protein